MTEEREYIPYKELGVANGDEWDSLSDEEQRERLCKASEKRRQMEIKRMQVKNKGAK